MTGQGRGRAVYVAEVLVERFRSCEQVQIPLRPEVTVLVGENNAGKSSVIDALRLLTDPLDGRRVRYFEESDVLTTATAQGGPSLQLDVAGIGPQESGAYLEALLPQGAPDSRTARWQVCWTPPQTGGRRGSTVWAQGAGLPVTGALRRGAVCGMSIFQRCAMPSGSSPRRAEIGCG
ncbi:AAA family ATPase [Streptomyces sp. NPDC048430]|uniref:AAA family ATPase n=1 Tax=unclassified Streptomyces TaxID=2593676 RepID=UPI00342381C6